MIDMECEYCASPVVDCINIDGVKVGVCPSHLFDAFFKDGGEIDVEIPEEASVEPVTD